MSDMIQLTVDGQEVSVSAGATVMEACEAAGREIPRFCYHERLSIAGNCRMCLVEVERMPKPVASCAMPAANGMVVRTDAPGVHKARKGVMEFLLINHPLDCPICDQGGECDLQDQAVAYGADGSRFAENKRAVEDKYMGPLIKTVMTRCIHCTRCVRFASEVAGAPELGAAGRGEDMEITTYLEAAVTSELSGNVIDLCPVGALTSKPYAFTARPWELEHVESVDVMDAMGAAIRVDTRGGEVMRILPRVNEAINEEWITDKSRFVWDGLRAQRLDRPYARGADGRLRECSWGEALARVGEAAWAAGTNRMAALGGDLACAESLFSLETLLRGLGVMHMDCREPHSPLGRDREGKRAGRGGYLFNAGIAGVDEADAVLVVGADVRREAALLDARLRRAWRERGVPVGVIGGAGIGKRDYEAVRLGGGVAALEALASGNAGEAAAKFASLMAAAARPLVIVGQGALARVDGAAVHDLALSLAEKWGAVSPAWNGFCVLHTAAGRVGGLEVDFLPSAGGRDTAAILQGYADGEIRWLYLLGADEYVPAARKPGGFIVYQGSHGDAGAQCADVVLPGAAYTEKDALWVNTEGRAQMGRRALFPPGAAQEDWRIVRKLSEVMGRTLPWDDVGALRAALRERAACFAAVGELLPPAAMDTLRVFCSDKKEAAAASERNGDDAAGGDYASSEKDAAGGGVAGGDFVSPIRSFHLSNAIARSSAVMAECARLADKEQKQ